jgi:hypothetical protein
MQIRDRITEFRRVHAADLRPNPRNWRVHPNAQRNALRSILAEIGYASALVVRELDDGSLELIDGHLRAETTPDALVPVLIVDLDDDEAAKLLATFDPISSMADTDRTALSALVATLDINDAALREQLHNMIEPTKPLAPRDETDKPIPEVFQVVVECGDEEEQRAVFERMTADGYTCMLLTL